MAWPDLSDRPAEPVGRPVRVVSLIVLVACAVAPGIVALSQGGSPWGLAGVLPLLVALVALARDHDRRVEQAARRLVAAEQERARLAESVAQAGLAREQAKVDGLTGLGNRRVLRERLQHELAMGRRTGAPVGLVLLDLDDFKAINDTHGHPVGDRVLAAVGTTLRSAVRATDTVTRWGGEEFAVVLPHTDLEGAAVAAETVRTAIARIRVPLGRDATLPVTASVGVASAPGCAHDLDDLYAVADKALYAAKQRGKNRVAVAAPGAFS